MAFDQWASTYELFEGETARETWRTGILADLSAVLPSGGEILDVGAGTGIGGRVLAAELPGARVTSLDRSAEMLRIGGITQDLAIVADMADFDLPARFDAVVSGFDALNYLRLAELCGFMTCASRCLRPGGHVIFDYSTARVLREDWGHLETQSRTGGLTLCRRHHYDELLERSETVLTLLEDDQPRWQEVHVQYAYDSYQILCAARRADLTVLNVRSIDGGHFTPDTTTHVYRLRKNGGS